MFLFHTGSIKSDTGAQYSVLESSFYSILVRLKANLQGIAPRQNAVFLFHTGSIKRVNSTLPSSII